LKTIAQSTDNHATSFGGVTSFNVFSYADGGKRLIDLILAMCLLPILAPVIAILWFVVRRDGGSGFFGHKRVGLNGQTFKCWKLRSMCVDADVRLARHLESNPAAAKEWARDFKLENDPRITRFGRFIRETSLDELPQIWNVLKGEMSLVGPRPVTQEELERYGTRAAVYRSMRPGITGAWQVSGRNDVSYSRRVALDVQYARRMSFLGDIGIIFATVGAVLNRTGK